MQNSKGVLESGASESADLTMAVNCLIFQAVDMNNFRDNASNWVYA